MKGLGVTSWQDPSRARCSAWRAPPRARESSSRPPYSAFSTSLGSTRSADLAGTSTATVATAVTPRTIAV